MSNTQPIFANELVNEWEHPYPTQKEGVKMIAFGWRGRKEGTKVRTQVEVFRVALEPRRKVGVWGAKAGIVLESLTC